MTFVNGKFGRAKLSPEQATELTSLSAQIGRGVEKQIPFAVITFKD